MERAFWIVSLIIALTDVLFIYVNYVSDRKALYDGLAEQGKRQETTFHLNLRKQGLQMQQFAAFLANQPEVRELFLAGRQAVFEEGGGPGGERAAAVRQQLYDLVSPGWRKVTDTYQVRQLHFHIGPPGDISFLRVHSPEKFGDDLSTIRHTITHAIWNNQPVHGFESGRVYPGIRGVVPIAVEDRVEGGERVVGALEAGSAFGQMLRLLETDTGTAHSVLMTEAYFRETHWPDFAARRLAERPMVDGWFVEATNDEPTIRRLLADPAVAAILNTRRPVISEIDGKPLAVYSFPFRDFLRSVEPARPPIGAVVTWQDASHALAATRESLRTNLLLGLVGFLVIEILLFTAWRMARGRLQRVIDAQVHELSETNRELSQEVARRVKTERELKDYQLHLQSLVDARTRSLSDSVQALRREVEHREQIEQILQRERDQARVTLRSIVDGVITTDAQGRVQYLNPAAETLTGWPLKEAKGQPLQQVFPARDMERGGDSVGFCDCLSGRCERQHGENTELTRRGGETITVEHSVSPILGENGERHGLVLVFHDDTETRELAVQLSYQASHDALTGLVNRRAIDAELAEALRDSHAQRKRHAFLYVDLDQFKVVNDTSGHVAGDELLRQLARLLQQKVRESDCLARLGGDEFGLLLRDCPLEKARAIADELLETVRQFRFVWEGRTFRVGTSIGIAAVDESTPSVEAILSAADTACYLAKEKGRGRVHLSLPDDGELHLRQGEMRWVSRIQQALSDDRFVLYGQPIVPVSGVGIGAVHQEILVRMLDRGGELIPPNAFIPAAERYGVMTEIDRWVIDRTFRLIGRMHELWPGEPPGFFNINLSGDTMADADILTFIRESFARHAVSPGRICFEITETAAIANMSAAVDLMTALKGDGCRFALDDFGSGLSSFGYLKVLPVDYLKIDGGFVRRLHLEPVDRVMVQAINEVGHAMRLKTIAECVENEAILRALQQIGVDYAQGYGVGRPVALSPAA